ncbi:MAG: LacI family DNA-binding transcriptional regulator [Eisenbergiella massiliensis]|uniref:LacI family DNA-binding transcriptional regulator n=1 Tax=Eisenbergiella massiliensis TaxID=1720294 RepID=UPI003992B338
MVTLKEIAQECNVSATTVSNILNGKPKVSEETRLKVLEVVKKRGYQPNYIAQGLRNQKTRMIGIIAEDIAQFGTPGIIESIMAFCEENGYRTIVQNLRLHAK